LVEFISTQIATCFTWFCR